MTELLEQRRRINLHLSGDITITSTHRRNTENIRTISSVTRTGYGIKKSTRRNITASAFFLFVTKKHQIAFLTLTFPEKIKKGVRINPMLHRFIANMRKNYGMQGFLWTRENTKAGWPHFHLLCDMPYKPIQKINSAWCEAIGMQSKNAVRLPKNHKGIIEDIEKTSKYVTKYITKNENEKFSERCYSISHDIKAEPIRLSEFDFRVINIDHGKDLKYRYFDHCTTVKIWDFYKKSDYFIEFLGNYTENSKFWDESGVHSNSIESLENERTRVKTGSFQLDLNFDP